MLIRFHLKTHAFLNSSKREALKRVSCGDSDMQMYHSVTHPLTHSLAHSLTHSLRCRHSSLLVGSNDTARAWCWNSNRAFRAQRHHRTSEQLIRSHKNKELLWLSRGRGGGSAPRSNPLPFIYHFFQKRHSFRIPFIGKRHPFHIPS